MAETTYDYDKDALDEPLLTQEVLASGIPSIDTELVLIENTGEVSPGLNLHITLLNALSPGDKSTLDTVVANHPQAVSPEEGDSVQLGPGGVIEGDLLPDATEVQEGIAELATQAETDAGTDDLRIVTPLKLAQTSLAGRDLEAIHDNVSGEIAAVAEKTLPVSADLLLIEDSAAGNSKKRVQIGNLPGGGSAIAVEDEGTPLTAAVSKFNFVGAGVTVTEPVTDEMLVTIPGQTGGDLAGVVVGHSLVQALSVGSFGTLNWNTTHFENNAAVLDHDSVTNNSRLTIGETGAYLIFYSVTFDPPAGVSTFQTRIIKNGVLTALAGSQRMMAEDDEPQDCSSVFVATLSAGDYIEFQAQASVGPADMDIKSTFGAIRMRGSKGDQGPPGSGSTITVKDEGVTVAGGPHSKVNFVGAGVTATDAGGGEATVTIPSASLPIGQVVTGSTLITTTSTTHTLATGMTITPAAGTYIVTWTASLSTDSTSDREAWIRVFAGGVAQGVEQRMQRGDSSTDNIIGVCTVARVTVNGAQAIEGRWRTSGSNGEMYGRSMSIVQVKP